MTDGNFRDRMRAFTADVAPFFRHPDRDRLVARIAQESERDLGLRKMIEEFKERARPFLLTRMEGGSGFPLANTLRSFFLEYFDRFRKMGPDAFPSSFNVVESFLKWSPFFFAFDLRQEHEHLLRLEEYIDWYTSGGFPNNPRALREIMPEGVIHCYNFIAPIEDFALRTVDSEIRVLGLALVRHGSELSALLLGGEKPPFPPDEDAGFVLDPSAGRKALSSDPSYTVASRYLPELPDYARIVMLARFDIDRARYDVRYVNLDVGPSYRVLTDDLAAFTSADRDEMMTSVGQQLVRYDGLFSAIATMLFLPAFFIDQGTRVVETKFATELHVRGASPEVRSAVKLLGGTAVSFFRAVRCLSPGTSGEVAEQFVAPPDFTFESTGYWRPLVPGEVGEDRDGQPIVGKTWVERNETWSAQSMKAFVLGRVPQPIPDGADPGHVYVLRSGTHVADLYKIGLTRRSVSTRASELSGATGVPTGFEVLARWSVGDCSKVEAAVHTALARFRVNKRREFFRVDLQTIVTTIPRVIREVEATS